MLYTCVFAILTIDWIAIRHEAISGVISIKLKLSELKASDHISIRSDSPMHDLKAAEPQKVVHLNP